MLLFLFVVAVKNIDNVLLLVCAVGIYFFSFGFVFVFMVSFVIYVYYHVLPLLRTKFEERAFSYAGPQEWNALPSENIRHETSRNCFKRQFNIFLH